MRKLYSYITSILHLSSEEDKTRFYKVLLPTIIIQVTGMAAAILVSLIMGRLMGATNYGIYAYCFSVVVGIVNLMVHGLNNFSLRETSSLLALEKFGHWKGFMSWSISLLLLVSVTGSIIAAVLFYFFPLLPNDAYRIPMLIACTSIPLYSFLFLLSSVLRGMHKVRLSQLSEKLIRPIALLFMLVILYCFERKIALYPALIINSISFGIALLFIAWKYREASLTILKEITPEYEISRWIKELSGLFLFGILISLDAQMDIYMLGYLRPPAEVGIYKIANTIAMSTAFFLGVSNVVLAPSFARLHVLQEREKLQRLVTQTIRWVMLLTAPVCLVLIILSHWILSFWGPEFVKGQAALIMLCIANLINSAFGSVGSLALMSKFEKYNGMVILLSIVINIVLNLLLTPRWGLNGTAFACALSIIVWNMTLFFIIKHKTGLRTWVFASGNHIKTDNE